MTKAELQVLIDAGTAESGLQHAKIIARGLPVSVLRGKTQLPMDNLPVEVNTVCKAVLQRTMALVDEMFPSVVRTRFHSARRQLSISQLYSMGELEFAHREPAINVYSSKGEFSPHKDNQGLTILFPLSNAGTDYEGGGTGFWTQDTKSKPTKPPNVVLKPIPGTALLFAGHVTHAGLPVETGLRMVFVASFSDPQKVKDEVA
jgi:hypothetical protein